MRRASLIACVAIAAASLANASAAAAPLAAQTSDVQMVAVTVTPKALPGTGEWQFGVTMNTHVAPLDDDLPASAVLVDPQGRTYAPIAWRGDGPGGHHRKGVLAFAPVTPRPATIELRVQRRGEPTARSFKWVLSGP